MIKLVISLIIPIISYYITLKLMLKKHS